MRNLFSALLPKKRQRYRYRCAVRGCWVTEAYAKDNPRTTIGERIK